MSRGSGPPTDDATDAPRDPLSDRAEIDAYRRERLLAHREEVRDKWMRVTEHRLEGRGNQAKVNRAAYEIAEWFVADLAPLMRPEFGDDPPTEVDWWNREVGRFTLPSGDVYAVESIDEFLSMDPLFTYEWEAEASDPFGEPDTRSSVVTVPADVSKQAIRIGEHFMADIGLRLDMVDDSGGANWSAKDDPSDW